MQLQSGVFLAGKARQWKYMNNPYRLCKVNNAGTFILTPYLTFSGSFNAYGKSGKILNIYGECCELTHTGMALRNNVCLLDPRIIECQFSDNILVVRREFV